MTNLLPEKAVRHIERIGQLHSFTLYRKKEFLRIQQIIVPIHFSDFLFLSIIYNVLHCNRI